MSPEVNDSFMDASVLEEQARKKGSLDPLEVDAVFTRSDPHIVQSSLHAGKLTRITPLQSGQVVSGVEMATAKTFPSWFQPASVSQVELDSISRIFGHDAVGEEGIARYIDKRRKILGGETLEPSDYNTAVWSVLRHLDVIGGSLREERRVPEVDTKKRGVDFCWGCGKDLQKVGNRTAFAVSIPTLSGHGDVLAVCRECAATGKTPDGSNVGKCESLLVRRWGVSPKCWYSLENDECRMRLGVSEVGVSAAYDYYDHILSRYDLQG
ncbi:hypothetical protein FOZ60_001647 [Perkinsus olseni]|uniref:Uncharacterized protein n=1 Tax=Perkinsus olseni TaxID=32597 RepID=A0A7J6P107_PEROL|nr:hypothetical protein FOZ60_001647 [Perkinsus olseni]